MPTASFNHKVLWVSAAEFIIHRSPSFLLPLCIHSIITGLQSFGFSHPLCVGHHVLHVRTLHMLDLFHTQRNRTERCSGLKHENPDYVSDPVLSHLDSTRTYYIRFNKMWTVQPLPPPTSSYPESLLGSCCMSKIDPRAGGDSTLYICDLSPRGS